MNTPPDFTTYTRDHWSCLLDIERRAVDNDGMFGRTTELELEAIAAFERDEIVRPWRGRHSPIKLTDRGWSVAHAIRRARAENAPRETWPVLARAARDSTTHTPVALALRHGPLCVRERSFDEALAAKGAEGQTSWTLVRGE